MRPLDRDQLARTATIAAVTAGLVIAQQVGAKAVRDGLFPSSPPIGALPKVMIAAVGTSLVALVVMTRALARLGPRLAVPLAFVGSALLFVAEWALLHRARAAVSVVAYLHIAAIGGITVSGFWSIITERFDPRTARKVIGRVNTGGALGGLLGGLLIRQCAGWLDIGTMLLGLAFANGLVALFTFVVAGAPCPTADESAGPLAGLRLLKETRYLRLLGALVAFTGAAAALSDYAFKTTVAARLPDAEAMTAFFAVFHGVTGLVTLLVQAAFARRALDRLGLAVTVAILPGSVVLLGLVGAGFTSLASVVALRGVEATLSHSLFRSAYELFFTPLRPEKKRPTKAIVDVAFDRTGDALASAVVMLAAILLPTRAASLSIAVAVAASASALWIAYRLHRGYVAALGAELRTGALVLAPTAIVDATTRNTLAQTSEALTREKLLQEIAKLRAAPVPPVQPVQPVQAVNEPSSGAQDAATRPLVTRLEDLLSGDVPRTVQALALPLDPRLVPWVIDLVAQPELRHDALLALRRVHGRSAGTLADALLDPRTPASVRAALPPLLAFTGDARAAEALIAGLGDPRFDVRVACARALADVREREPDLELSRPRLVARAMRDLDALRTGASERHVVLAHVFDVLALAFADPDLRLAGRAFATADERLHGTALEYLENVLPEELRGRLLPLLHEARAQRAWPPRARERVADDLRSSLGDGR